jgi:AI-2 transport protein TqsA
MCDSMSQDRENELEMNSILTKELRILLKQKLPIVTNVCLVLFIGGFTLQVLAPVLQPFAMAVLAYLILRPGARYLMKEFKMGEGWSYFFILLMFINILVGGFVAIAYNVQEYLENGGIETLETNYADLYLTLNNTGLNVSGLEDPFNSLGANQGAGFIGTLGGYAFSAVTMILFLVFIIYEMPYLEGRVARAFPGNKAKSITKVTRKIEASVNAYLITKTNVSIGTGICTGLICLLLGVPLWFVWGILAFLFNYVPYIGSIIASVPAIILGFLAIQDPLFGLLAWDDLGGQWVAGTLVLVIIIANQQLWGAVIETKWTGNQLDVSPVLLLLTFAYGGFVWGPIGMILSAPITVIVKIILENIEPTRPIAILMQERVRSLRELYSEAYNDGKMDKAESGTIALMCSDLGINEDEAILIAARAAFDSAVKNHRVYPNDVEMTMIAKACKILNLSLGEQEHVLSVLDDGIISNSEAKMLDEMFSGQIGGFNIEEE